MSHQLLISSAQVLEKGNRDGKLLANMHIPGRTSALLAKFWIFLGMVALNSRV